MLKRLPYCCGGNRRERKSHPLMVHPRIIVSGDEEKLSLDLE
jgi:hypothetical protein